ncbi:MAG: hypothetical protein DMG41_09710 [Acidobacteria bacterium]|nr:MAG: hypothetical protein DMG41_09710 [Acidobacteriota bacterium]
MRNACARKLFYRSIRLRQEAGQDALRPTVSISYQYRDSKAGRLEAEKNPWYSEQSLLESLKKARAELRFAIVHASLTAEAVVCPHLENADNSFADDQNCNDPCPCGSGKKWKRCYGA